MIWTRRSGWRRTFALFPIILSEQAVWLQWVWVRSHGDHYEVALEDPSALSQTQEEKTNG